MRSSEGKVLLSFSDASLGGTGRSAAMMGTVWRQLGRSVVFTAREGLDARRVPMFNQLGEVCDLADVDWAQIGLVHFHHAAGEASNAEALSSLIASAGTVRDVPSILTHNIFATPDRFLDSWPAPRATAVLGEWAAWQYRYGMALRGNRSPFVLGNPQDVDFFRPPTPAERAEARHSLGVGSERVVMRVGSPIMAKWSHSYERLVAELVPGELLLTCGAPDELMESLAASSRHRVIPMTSDDSTLRAYYWSADVVAVDAERGESFGNVITEALLSGVPVTYRARTARDNTPWEFQQAQGFDYSVEEAGWVSATLSRLRDARTPRSVDREWVVDHYGADAAALRLNTVVEMMDAAGVPGRRVWRPMPSVRPTRWDRAAIFVRHNALISLLKEQRRRLQA